MNGNRWSLAVLGLCPFSAALFAQTMPPKAGLPATNDWNRVFGQPTKTDKPLVRWWWPGGDVDDAEIVREVDMLDAAGFGGAEVQPFNPGILNVSAASKARINDYATPSFFAHMKAAANEAADHGMQIDYTFGSAWPTGGGFAITPDLALRELTMARTEVTGGGTSTIRVDIPKRSRKMGAFNSLDPRSRDPKVIAAKAAFDAIDKVVAVIAIAGSAPTLRADAPGGFKLFPWHDVAKPGTLSARTALVLTDKLRDDGTLDWKAPAGTWQIFVFKEFAVNSGNLAGVGAGPQLVADHFDAAAFAAHARRVGDPLIAALGAGHRGLGATFVDSFELMPDLYWSRDLLTEFRKRRGYDLTPYLPFILQPGWMEAWSEHYSPPYFEDRDVGERVRADYRLTISELMLERFVRPFVQWNRSNRVKSRLQAHGSPTDILQAYGMADIPETEDLVDGGNPYFMRLARSAANIYGRRIISAESMAWPGRPYSVTLADMRTRADRIFASGVNQLVFHGMPYAYQRDRWPGWHAFAPISFSAGFSTFLTDTNPLWAGVPRLTSYVARMQSLMRQGKAVVPVAVLLGEIGFYGGIETEGKAAYGLERRLIAGGYDYDRINADAINHARMVNGRLVTAGGAVFPALVVPKTAAIRAETAEQISRFVKSGLTVRYVDSAPSRGLGLFDHDARDRRVRNAVEISLKRGARRVSDDDLVASLRDSRVPSNLRFGGDASNLIFVQRRIGDRLVTFVHNAADQPRTTLLTLTVGGQTSRWDAMDGKQVPLVPTYRSSGTTIPLSLAIGESALLLTEPRVATRPRLQEAVQYGEQLLPATSWLLQVDGHGDDRQQVRRAVPITELSDFSGLPSLSHFSGLATYTTRFALSPSLRKPGTKIMLDLGEVHDMATITLNGRQLPPLIAGPWRVDVTRMLSATGTNTLAVAVANVPNNAMIDPAKPADKTFKPVPAGLRGPVKLITMRQNAPARRRFPITPL